MKTSSNTQVEITPDTIAQVVAAITKTGPKVDYTTYKAHVPKFVLANGTIVATAKTQSEHAKALPKPLAQSPTTKVESAPTLTLYDEVRASADFAPLMAAYEARNWKHFRAHTVALMGDFDAEIDCHIGQPDSLTDRFFDEVYELDGQLRASKDHNPVPTAALLIGLVVESDPAKKP